MVSNAGDKVRTLIVWEVPVIGTPGFIEMYINPQNIQIKDRKLQNTVRTKGGYILQYWGEELTSVTISGGTGDGGIEALNVLRDVYRSEQLAMIKFLKAQGSGIKRQQSLAELAASVVMWYQGQGYRGFFSDFSYTEDADDLGIFRYNTTFTAVEILGRRENFLPWQRKPWSTLDNPSFADGQGSTTGGGYNTRFKLGELNMPAVGKTLVSGGTVQPVGTFADPKFSGRTGIAFTNTAQQQELAANFEENAAPLTPANLFANAQIG